MSKIGGDRWEVTVAAPAFFRGDLQPIKTERFADEKVELELLPAEQLPPTNLDTEQLKRVFVNLTENALEALATTPDERRLTIRTRHDSARDLLIAIVEDTGEGIPAGDFKRLFQPYFSTRGRETGLGLAIVARIITEHGGRVYAEANVPHGARFVIELPVGSQ